MHFTYYRVAEAIVTEYVLGNRLLLLTFFRQKILINTFEQNE